MNVKKKIRLGKKIAEHELAIHEGKNIEFHQQKIEEIIASLSMEELLEVDDYIQLNGLVKH